MGSGLSGSVPITYEEAKAQGKEKDITWVDNCDPTTGRIKMPSIFAPPCVPKFRGDNGGNLGIGVTKDEVTVVVYIAPQNGDLMSRLAANLDDEEKVKATYADYVKMLNDLYETYGRKVNFVRFDADRCAQRPSRRPGRCYDHDREVSPVRIARRSGAHRRLCRGACERTCAVPSGVGSRCPTRSTNNRRPISGVRWLHLKSF